MRNVSKKPALCMFSCGIKPWIRSRTIKNLRYRILFHFSLVSEVIRCVNYVFDENPLNSIEIYSYLYTEFCTQIWSVVLPPLFQRNEKWHPLKMNHLKWMIPLFLFCLIYCLTYGIFIVLFRWVRIFLYTFCFTWKSDDTFKLFLFPLNAIRCHSMLFSTFHMHFHRYQTIGYLFIWAHVERHWSNTNQYCLSNELHFFQLNHYQSISRSNSIIFHIFIVKRPIC